MLANIDCHELRVSTVFVMVFVFGQVLSPHHSDQMSWIALKVFSNDMTECPNLLEIGGNKNFLVLL